MFLNPESSNFTSSCGHWLVKDALRCLLVYPGVATSDISWGVFFLSILDFMRVLCLCACLYPEWSCRVTSVYVIRLANFSALQNLWVYIIIPLVGFYKPYIHSWISIGNWVYYVVLIEPSSSPYLTSLWSRTGVDFESPMIVSIQCDYMWGCFSFLTFQVIC